MVELKKYIEKVLNEEAMSLKKEIMETERNISLVRSGKTVSFMVVIKPHPRIAYDKGVAAENFYGKNVKEAKKNAAAFKRENVGSIAAVYAIVNETRAKIILPKNLWK